MDGIWAFGGYENQPLPVGRLVLTEPRLRTSVLPRAVQVDDPSASRHSSSPQVKCLPTRCDFPV
jgi:hypothetical protein